MSTAVKKPLAMLKPGAQSTFMQPCDFRPVILESKFDRVIAAMHAGPNCPRKNNSTTKFIMDVKLVRTRGVAIFNCSTSSFLTWTVPDSSMSGVGVLLPRECSSAPLLFGEDASLLAVGRSGVISPCISDIVWKKEAAGSSRGANHSLAQ